MEEASYVGEEGQMRLQGLSAKQQERVGDAAKKAAQAFSAGVGAYSVPRALAGSINTAEELAAVCTELACVVALRAVSDAFSQSTMLEAFFSDRLECYTKLESRDGYGGAPSSIDEPVSLRYGRFSDRPPDLGRLTAAASVEHGRKLGKALVDLLRAVPSTPVAGGAFNQLYLALANEVAKGNGRAASQPLPRIAQAERNGFVMRVPQSRGREIGAVAYLALTPLFETWLWLFGRPGAGGSERKQQCGPSNEIVARALDLASGGPRKESAAVTIAGYMAPAFAAAAANNKSAARVLEALLKTAGAGPPPDLIDVSPNAPARPDAPSERIANAVAAMFVQGCEDLVARHGAHLQKEAALLLNVCRDPRLADRMRRLLAEISKVGKDRIKQWKKTSDRLYPTGWRAPDAPMAGVIEIEDEEDGDNTFAATDAKKSSSAAAAFAAAFADTLGAYCIPRANAADTQSASSRGLAASANAVYGLGTELVGLVALDYVARRGAASQLDAFYGSRLAQFYQKERQGQVGRDRSDQFDYFRNLRHEVPLDKPRFKKGGAKPPALDGKLARKHGERLGKALLDLLKSSDFKKVQATLYPDVVAELAKNVAVHADASYALPSGSGPLASRESQIASALLDTLFETYVAYFARSAAPPAREAVKDKWSRAHASTEMFARYLQQLVGARGKGHDTDPDSLKRLAKRISSSKNKAVTAVTADLIGEFPTVSPDEPLPVPSAGFPSVPYSEAIEDLVFEGYALACEALDADMRADKFDAKKRSNVVRYVRGGLIAATPFDARIDQIEKLLRNPGMIGSKCAYDDYDEFERAGYEMAQYIMEETGKKKSKSEKLEEKAKKERHKEHEKAKKDYDRAKRAMKKTKSMVDAVAISTGASKRGWTYEEDRFQDILQQYAVSDVAIAALEQHNVRTLSDLADAFKERTVDTIVGHTEDAARLAEIYAAHENGYFDRMYPENIEKAQLGTKSSI